MAKAGIVTREAVRTFLNRAWSGSRVHAFGASMRAHIMPTRVRGLAKEPELGRDPICERNLSVKNS
jgi:hypothetical protein